MLDYADDGCAPTPDFECSAQLPFASVNDYQLWLTPLWVIEATSQRFLQHVVVIGCRQRTDVK